MWDPQVTTGFNTNSWSSMTWMVTGGIHIPGTPHLLHETTIFSGVRSTAAGMDMAGPGMGYGWMIWRWIAR